MKKIISIFALIVFTASCAVINPIHTERRTRALQSSYVYMPYGWFGWYGVYHPYYFYGGFSGYQVRGNYRIRGNATNTKTIITKRQLKVGETRSVSNTTRNVVRREDNRSVRSEATKGKKKELKGKTKKRGY